MSTGEAQIAKGYATSLYWGNPSGGMYSTTGDMLKFMTRVLAKDSLLSRNGFEQYFLPGAILSDGVSSFGKFGWEVAYSNGFRTLTKNGMVGGFNSEIAFVPELKLGTFIWSNLQQADSSALSALAQNLLVPLILSELANTQPKHDVPPEDKFIGDYYDDETEIFEIRKADNFEETGLYYASIIPSQIYLWGYYDKQTTLAYGQDKTYFFRFFLTSEDSCFSNSMGGMDDTVIKFFNENDSWKLTYLDLADNLTMKQ